MVPRTLGTAPRARNAAAGGVPGVRCRLFHSPDRFEDLLCMHSLDVAIFAAAGPAAGGPCAAGR
jgi:hypothetical protein